ncbi:probable E3 ubiquitin-protein ligase XERICO isoform X1 [Salvia miltiorrhiza]|uniref:probable E3 ubiquitin-protein ligase XERICO isoform X1 n=1 Tax=Salvia miltiorrhiza TaxID=226208 RepID=UPI0025AC3CFB|nr:probable E3 ubiquitin-protein ligase XERICO isoform X1 [Salvia miltiorrhiza]
MAGMLPGVEAARRRRFHQKSNHAEPSPAVSGCTRRSSLCLYVSSHDFHLCSSASSTRSQIVCDESRLGAEAREAKKRLDERLQAQWRSETTREVEKVKKSGSKRLKWLKLRRRSSEEEECAVCLDQINGDPETLMQLRCGHRFHTLCLLPWLEANAHCPCCRMQIPSPTLL